MAKMASTLDQVSNGRLEMGIGACWSELECLERGIDWPSAEVRLQMLGESVQIIKRLWTQEKTDFEGRHYALNGVYSEPKPLQKPYPPIMIGGGGEGFTLRLVAKYAEKSNFGGSPIDVERKMNALKRHCKDVGRDFNEIVKSTNLGVIVYQTREEYLEDMRRRWKNNNESEPFDEWLKKAEAVYIGGTPDECVEQLRRYTELGVSLFVIRFGDLPSLEGLRLFAKNVIPQI
jgi:alkanesulfonate monooxygenase SsuD/methylene tetrahydromethanopterin reductase-like flavin-dependent oxidoreductase (luciferase family)